MKKLFMILCVMVMSLAFVSLTGCGGSDSGDAGEAPAADSPYIGSWIATSAEFNDEEVDLAEALEEGDYIIVLNEDGTASSSYGDENTTGNWTVTDNGVKLRGDDMKMDLVDEGDGTVSTEIFGFKMYFEKTAAEE